MSQAYDSSNLDVKSDYKYLPITNPKANPMQNRLATMKNVIHGTYNYNRGADAAANIRYMNSGVSASTQRFVDEDGRYRTMDFNGVAYSVGAKSYTKLGSSLRLNGYTPNHTTTSTETCVNKDGNFSDTFRHLIEDCILTNYKYGLDNKDDTIRHFDVTGKLCPDFYINDEEFAEFKDILAHAYSKVFGKDKLTPSLFISNWVSVTADVLNVRPGFNTNFDPVATVKRGEQFLTNELINGYYHIGNNRWISAKYTKRIDEPVDLEEAAKTGDVEVYDITDEDFNYMKVISFDCSSYYKPDVNSLMIKSYEIDDIIQVKKQVANWYQMKDNSWIHASDLVQTQFREVMVYKEKQKIYLAPYGDSEYIEVPAENPIFKYGISKVGDFEWLNVKWIEREATRYQEQIKRNGYIRK